MISKREKVISTEGTELSGGNIADVQGNYKYLGVPQVNGNGKEATVRYFERVRQVLKSRLNGWNKI